MKNQAFLSALLLFALAGIAGVAHAEDPNAPPPDQVMQPADNQAPPQQEEVYQDPNQQPVYQDPNQQPVYQDPNQQPVYQDPNQDPNQQVQVVEQDETAETGRGIQYGAHIVVPVFLANNSDRFNPTVGIGVQGRIGWEFGAGFSAELHVGILYAATDVETHALTDIWLGGGIRYSFLNETAIVPFVGVGIVANIWNNAYSGSTTAATTGDSVVTFGANGNVGVQIEISPYIGLEAGAQLNWSTDPGTYIESQPILWLSPFLGGTLYF